MMKPSRTLTLIPLLALALVAAGGCAKKKAPATAAEMPIETERVAETPQAPAAEPTPAPETDIWSGDLAALNAYVREQGLLQTVYFDFDRAELRPDARERLAGNARFLEQRPELIVAIEGHADERGTNEYNLALGDRRAESTRSYLGSLGVEGERTKAVSYGEERPECTDSAEDCWWRNRRAEFVIVGRRAG
jgi:peptidoglycan-associated lipoprotein